MADLSVGAEFAGCRIEGVAGRGGMGVVYRAMQVALDRLVALKVIAPDLALDGDFRARFQREARLAASIEHPNVLPVYEAGERDGVLFLTTRYVEGTDLRALLRRDGPLDPARAAELLAPVALALNAAHQRGLVHRDVKPANVLIAAPGDAEHEHVYLTDFGIARGEGTAAGEMTVTRTGAFVGTLDYMAPERMTGERGDARSDVYAFGCMLFQALSGRVPFPREQDVARIHAHVNDPFPTLLEVRPDVPPAIDAVVQRACAKNPDDRFASAGALARALEAAANEGGAATVASDEARPTAETVAATDAPTADTTPAPARPLPPRAPVADPAPPAGPPPPTQRRGYVLPGIIGAVVIAVIVAVIALSSGGGSSKDPSTPPSSTPTQASTAAAVPSAVVREAGSIFTMDAPKGWQKRDNATGRGLKRTTWTDPDDPQTAILVDPVPQVRSTPEGRARGVDATFQRTKPGYRRIGLDPATIAGRSGYELIYEIGGVRYLDQFVNLDCQDGYAVQGQAPASRFLEFAPVFRRSANSLRSKPC
jgi:serine/threonine protein kinase